MSGPEGPESKGEIIEATPEIAIFRYTKCPVWERYEEFKVDSELRACDPGHPIMIEEGLKAVNSKITFTLKKSRLRGDPDCEDVYEFKEE